jgi:hypothetical protein
MFESLLGAMLPFFKDIVWTAAAALLAYTINKIQSHFNTI